MVISHDLNFIAAVADRILVIDKGRVVDQGTHEELVSRPGLYKTLYDLKNVDPSLLRSRSGGPSAAGPAPRSGSRVEGMGMPDMGGPPGMM